LEDEMILGFPEGINEQVRDLNLDNWIYVTVDPVRFRYRNDVLQVDTLISGSNGQWGLTHDNFGRLFFSNAGAENAGSGFQINPVYGQLDFNDAYDDGTFGKVWPIIKTPDVQGGIDRLRNNDSTLNHFTAACGQSIFRGDHLPKDLVGNYLINDPVARVIRRAKVINKSGKIILENVYSKQEFIASTDMNFRPVNTYTGPDGCLYIVDMHRGIIQEGAWTGPDTYLRTQIMRLKLDQNVQHGRIYRLGYDGMERGPKPQILNEPTKKLVQYLDHPNGWWRDNAQKEIIRRDDQSVINSLKRIAIGEKGSMLKQPSPLARIHALWTLEGLNSIDKDILFAAMQDKDAQVRRTAVWISEYFIKKDDEQTIMKVQELKDDESYDVLSQIILSLSYSKTDKAKAIMKEILAKNSKNEMLEGIQKSLKNNQEEEVKKFGSMLANLNVTNRTMILEGAITYKSICANCHGVDGKGLFNSVAPPLVGNYERMLQNKDAMIKILLNGLKGPVEGKSYLDIMPAMGANSNEWIAGVLSFIRYDLALSNSSSKEHAPGNLSKILVSPEQVKKIRDQTAKRKSPWTWAELEENSHTKDF